MKKLLLYPALVIIITGAIYAAFQFGRVANAASVIPEVITKTVEVVVPPGAYDSNSRRNRENNRGKNGGHYDFPKPRGLRNNWHLR